MINTNWYKQAIKNGRLEYFCNCVSWPQELLDALNALVDMGEDIELSEFKRNTFWDEIKGLIYPFPKKPKQIDWHVRYYKLPNWPIYWLTHSAIEYVFAERKTIELLQKTSELANENEEWFNPNIHTYEKMVREFNKTYK